MSNVRHLTIAFVLAMLALPATAEPVSYVTEGRTLFSFDAPDGWGVERGLEVNAAEMPEGVPPAPRLVSLLPPDEPEIMWTGLWAPEDVADFAQARTYIKELGPRLLEAPEVTFQESRVINGLRARVFSGVGFRDGRDMDFAMVAIQVAADQVAFAVFIGEPGAYDRHEAQLIGVLNSIRAGSAS